MAFSIERLKTIRESLGINKSEAARRLHLTAMGYGRYESGSRTTSYQTLHFMAQILGTSYEYLCEETDDPAPNEVVVSARKEPELFTLVQDMRSDEEAAKKRMTAYCRRLCAAGTDEPETES